MKNALSNLDKVNEIISNLDKGYDIVKDVKDGAENFLNLDEIVYVLKVKIMFFFKYGSDSISRRYISFAWGRMKSQLLCFRNMHAFAMFLASQRYPDHATSP